MNASTDFKPLPTPEPIPANSAKGQQMFALVHLYQSCASLSDTQTAVGAFAFFMSSQSIQGGMDDESMERALTEFSHMVRINRASLQQSKFGKAS